MENKPPVSLFLKSASVAAGFATVLNVIWYFLYEGATGYTIPDILGIAPVVMSSIVPLIIGGLLYYGLSRMTKNFTMVFIIIAAVFTILSFGGPLMEELPDGSKAPEGFEILTIPMHIIAGGSAIFIMTSMVGRWVKKQQSA